MAETLSWIDPTGVETLLNGETFYDCMIGRQGFFNVPLDLIDQEVPLEPGSREKYIQIHASDPRLPLLVSAESESDLAMARRALVRAMNPMRGLGTLRFIAADGVTRELACRVVDGLRGDESDNARGPGWFVAGLIFRAADPFWYDASDLTLSVSPSTPTDFMEVGTAFLPLHLSHSAAAGTFSIDNDGDVEAWPVWTITGPGDTIVLTNNTTGEAITLSNNGGLSLSGGQTLTIDTRPGAKTLLRDDGSSKFSYLSDTSSLWALQPGNNDISLSMGSTTGASELRLAYKRRWLGV